MTHPGVTTTPGSDINHTLSAVHRRFAFARLSGSYLTGSKPALVSTTLTTIALYDSQLVVVWDRLLIAEPEGPVPDNLSYSYVPPFHVGTQDTR